MRVLSRLFRRLFLQKLIATHQAGRLSFFGDHAHLAEAQSFTTYLAPLRKVEWVVYAKRPFGGPEAVPAYLSRYTHRVAIANSRLIACDRRGVTFKQPQISPGSTLRDRITVLQIYSSRSPALNWPRQSTHRYLAAVANRSTTR